MKPMPCYMILSTSQKRAEDTHEGRRGLQREALTAQVSIRVPEREYPAEQGDVSQRNRLRKVGRARRVYDDGDSVERRLDHRFERREVGRNGIEDLSVDRRLDDLNVGLRFLDALDQRLFVFVVGARNDELTVGPVYLKRMQQSGRRLTHLLSRCCTAASELRVEMRNAA